MLQPSEYGSSAYVNLDLLHSAVAAAAATDLDQLLGIKILYNESKIP